MLVFGYLLWPQTWRAPLDEALRDAALALDAFVEAAFTGSPADRRRARRRNYRALTELQTQLQRRLAEPPPISNRAAAWWPVIVQLERTSDAVTEAVIATRDGRAGTRPRPGRGAAPGDPAARGRRPRPPRRPTTPRSYADGVLAPVAREVDTARRLVRENAPGRRGRALSRSGCARGAASPGMAGCRPIRSPSLPAPTGPPPPGSRTVTTDDGVPLHVEVDGDENAPLTVVLSHGFTARLAEWELQRAALRDRARLVLWDQRGHGRSGWTPLTRRHDRPHRPRPRPGARRRRRRPGRWCSPGTRWAA